MNYNRPYIISLLTLTELENGATLFLLKEEQQEGVVA